METVIVSVICIALMVIGGMTMAQGFLSSVDSTTMGLEEISDRDEQIMRTDLATINATQPSASILEVALRNDGQTKLASFSKWDVIVQYHDAIGSYQVKWLPYVDGTPGNDEWAVKGIYLNAENQTAEVFEPGILNPGEEMIIEVELSPKVGKDYINDVVISTPNGVPTSISFIR